MKLQSLNLWKRQLRSLLLIGFGGVLLFLYQNCAGDGFEFAPHANGLLDSTSTGSGQNPETCADPLTAQIVPCPVEPPPPPQAVTTWPTWRKEMKSLQWRHLEESDLSAVTPDVRVPGSLSARINAWNGLAVDTVTNKVYSATNGGHADYSGNEVYEIDLATESPRWRLLREPTPSIDIVAGNVTLGIFPDYYKDGRPSSTHTYYALHFISSKQSIFRFGSGSMWGTGNEGSSKTDSFSIPFNDWMPAGTWPDITPNRSGVIDVSICKNHVTEEVYINGDRIRKFNPATGTYTVLSPPTPGHGSDEDSRGGCAVDTKRNKILYFKDNYRIESGGLIYDIATDVLSRMDFSGPGLRGVRDATQGYGYYDPQIDVYIFKNQIGGQVFRIHPETFEANLMTTTGGEGIPNSINGVYTRFMYLPNLKGYAFYPAHGGGIWFLAMP